MRHIYLPLPLVSGRDVLCNKICQVHYILAASQSISPDMQVSEFAKFVSPVRHDQQNLGRFR